MSNYVFNNIENVSMSSSIAQFLNIHPKITHPNDSTDKIGSQDISLSTLKNLSNKNFYSPNVDGNTKSQINLLSFNNTSLMSVEIYTQRSNSSTAATGNIFIRPRYGSGKYILSWWRSTDSFSSVIRTISLTGPKSSYQGIGSLGPVAYYDFMEPFNTSGYVYEPVIRNTGNVDWSGFKIEILNLNKSNPTDSEKNYLRATCIRVGNDVNVKCTDTGNNRDGAYIDPVTKLKLIEIKDWTAQGSLTGSVFYNMDVRANTQVTLRQQVRFKSNTCTTCTGNPNYTGMNAAWRYPLTFKITPFPKEMPVNTDLLSNTEIVWPGETTQGGYVKPYFEEGSIISTARYLPPSLVTSNATSLSEDVELYLSDKDAPPDQVLDFLKTSPTVLNPIVGYKGVDDFPPSLVGPVPPVDQTSSIITFRLLDIETGQIICFSSRVGIKRSDGKTQSGGWVSWIPAVGLYPTYKQYVESQQSSFVIPDSNTAALRTNAVTLNYPGDDYSYTNKQTSPFW